MNRGFCSSPSCTRVAAPHSDLCYGCLKIVGYRSTVWHERSVRLYAIQGAELVKLGITSKSIKVRLADLQVGSPVPLTVLGHVNTYPQLEPSLHSCLVAHRNHGEWFRRQGEVLDVIAMIVAKDGSALESWVNSRAYRRSA